MADQIVPFYLVVDENDPTRGSFVNGLNALPSVLTGLAAQYPVVDARTRLCKLGFGQGARVIRSLAPPSAPAGWKFTARTSNGGDYREAFSLLAATIFDDARKLEREKVAVTQPAVYFVTGNEPVGEWLSAYRALLGTWSPHVFAFGYGNVKAKTIQQVATVRAHLVDRPPQAEEAAAAINAMLANALLGAARSSEKGNSASGEVSPYNNPPSRASRSSPGSSPSSTPSPTPRPTTAPPSASGGGDPWPGPG
jgi:uncharacterized protein YegL